MTTQPLSSAPTVRLPPGPAGRKNLFDDLLFFARFAWDPLGFVRNRFEQYGDTYFVPGRKGKPGLFVFRHPDHLREVLVTDAASYRKQHSAFELLSRVLGEGLLTSDGDVWKRQRRLVQPAFSRQRLAEYATLMADEAQRTTARWHVGESLDLNRAMMELTLRVVCRTLFSHEVTTETDDIAHAMAVLQDGTVGIAQQLPAWLPTPQKRRFDRAVHAIDTVVAQMVRTRRDAVARGQTPPADLLQALVTAVDEQEGQGLSEREVRDQLVTLFLAGHETTSHALTWALYLLSQHPETEQKLYAEVSSVLGGPNGRPPTWEDVERLPYTEQVLKEALRLYPPAFLIARGAERETRVGEWTIPQGSEVILWLYFTQRDPRFFDAPDAFRPERFAPGEEEKLHRMAYLPFGAGARACIGKVFAMVEGTLLLASLVQHFKFELVPGQRVSPRPRVTLGPRAAVQMRLRARPST